MFPIYINWFGKVNMWMGFMLLIIFERFNLMHTHLKQQYQYIESEILEHHFNKMFMKEQLMSSQKAHVNVCLSVHVQHNLTTGHIARPNTSLNPGVFSTIYLTNIKTYIKSTQQHFRS